MKKLFIILIACLPVFAMAQSKSIEKAASAVSADAKKDAKTAVEAVKKDAKAAATDAKKATATVVADAKKAVSDVKNMEKIAAFPGGEKAMNEWIYKNLKYPHAAIERGIQGTVYVKFTVTETGKIQDVKVTKGLFGACDQEAVRVIQAMPDWIPAQAMGKNVPMPYTVHIVFKLPTKKS